MLSFSLCNVQCRASLDIPFAPFLLFFDRLVSWFFVSFFFVWIVDIIVIKWSCSGSVTINGALSLASFYVLWSSRFLLFCLVFFVHCLKIMWVLQWLCDDQRHAIHCWHARVGPWGGCARHICAAERGAQRVRLWRSRPAEQRSLFYSGACFVWLC
jgi:hypothetical protein